MFSLALGHHRQIVEEGSYLASVTCSVQRISHGSVKTTERTFLGRERDESRNPARQAETETERSHEEAQGIFRRNIEP
jgi:hypothetical protein